jgi:CheY-like chemotaxis protein
MTNASNPPRALIVDDDAISLRFLEAAVRQAGCTVTAASDSAAAVATKDTFDVLLIDRRLPDMDGAALLSRLRERGVAAPAIATSAEIDAATEAQLRAAGFADVLEKPATVQRVVETVARLLPRALLNDDAALAALSNDAQAMRALRGLLADELRLLDGDLGRSDFDTDPIRLGERLHRLRASCGFCGATALAASAADWQQALRDGRPTDAARREAFRTLCRETISAIEC